ncbi:hypothetical protein DDR33_07050 [Pararcticibacter amylolyticus]|uniref:Uncharacterized protein n=1 Tax=Pararcticibacter amylolyticus TaxID=2173175 RepID=A0A2U2PJK9_9SPHI|nr:hypothetical protein DDR33_07050 [Pararcticibacter amylolyticus]
MSHLRFIKQLISYTLLVVLTGNVTVELLHEHKKASGEYRKTRGASITKQLSSKCFICEYHDDHKESSSLPATSGFRCFEIFICEFSTLGDERTSQGAGFALNSRGPPYSGYSGSL